MKKKIILFGAGAGSKIFIQNNKIEMDFVAISDNDTKKHETFYDGIPIISPSKIQEEQFDEIIITTQWVNEVKKQLVEEYGIQKEKIITPDKSLMKSDANSKPFEDPTTLKFAQKIITILCGKAHKEQLPLHIDFGTLIGIMRDGDLIPWDDDIDLAIEQKYQEDVEIFLLNNVQKIDKDVEWIIERISGYETPMDYIIRFVSDKYRHFTISVAIKEIKDAKAIKASSLGQWSNPAHCVTTLESINYKDTQIFIPSEHNKYLTYMYGDWKTPIKTTFADGYNSENMIDIPYAEFKKANFTTEIIFKG